MSRPLFDSHRLSSCHSDHTRPLCYNNPLIRWNSLSSSYFHEIRSSNPLGTNVKLCVTTVSKLTLHIRTSGCCIPLVTSAKACNLPACFQAVWEIKHPVIEMSEMFILEQDCSITREQVISFPLRVSLTLIPNLNGMALVGSSTLQNRS